jgi:hypothetical protein
VSIVEYGEKRRMEV